VSAKHQGPALDPSGKDQYSTPSWCIERLLEFWQPPKTGMLVEPCVGEGVFVKTINRIIGERSWITHDIDPVYDNADFTGDFLLETTPPWSLKVSCVISNPPYNQAEDIIRHSRFLYPLADIVMLLRMAFLESEARIDFFKEMGQPDMYNLPNRPSFRNSRGKDGLGPEKKGSTDMAAYSFFAFPVEPRDFGVHRSLNTTPLAIRKPKEVKG